MDSSEELQKKTESITKTETETEARLNTAMNMMERNENLDLKQKELLQDEKSKLVVIEQILSEKIEQQFQVKLSQRIILSCLKSKL